MFSSKDGGRVKEPLDGSSESQVCRRYCDQHHDASIDAILSMLYRAGLACWKGSGQSKALVNSLVRSVKDFTLRST